MDGKGFDFKPQQRREPRSFEPPPWEQEAFGELQRKRAAAAEDAGAVGTVGQDELQPQQRLAAPQEGQPAAVVAEAEQPAGSQLDEARVSAMLAGLAEEEPQANGLWKVAVAVAILLGAIGMVLTAWGATAVMATRNGGAVAIMGGSVLLVFGIGFIATAVWLGVRTLRQQGVL